MIKRFGFLSVVALAFLFVRVSPVFAETSHPLSDSLQEEFQKRFEWYRNQRQDLEQMLREHQALKQRAEEGTHASDPEVAEKNRQAVRVMEQAIATTQEKIRRIDVNIRALQKKFETCMEMEKKFASTREALTRLQRTLESGSAQFEELAKQSEEAVQGARTAAFEMLKTGSLEKLGRGIDNEITVIQEPKRVEELKRVKRAIDQTLANIDEMEQLGEHNYKPDLEKKLNMALSVLADPAVQNLLNLSRELAPLGVAMKSTVDYTYHATSFGLTWARIRQLSGNTGPYLQAVRALHEEMKKRVKELEDNDCQIQGGESFV